jgi:excisionase family DNA binding protein
MAAQARAIEAGQRYLSWADASLYTGLSVPTLRRLVRAGRLRLLIPVKRCPRLDREELDALMQGHRPATEGA